VRAIVVVNTYLKRQEDHHLHSKRQCKVRNMVLDCMGLHRIMAFFFLRVKTNCNHYVLIQSASTPSSCSCCDHFPVLCVSSFIYPGISTLFPFV
jgi:hypothetical protein